VLKAEDVIRHLERHQTKLTKLAGEEVGGFVLIVPPEGEPIEFLMMGSHPDYRKFMLLVRDRIVASGDDQGGMGAVRMPR
jgi:hypothetical protein